MTSKAFAESEATARLDLFIQWREQSIEENNITGLIQWMGGTESHRGIYILGRPVNPGALCAIKGQLLPVQGKKILAEKFAHVLKEIAKATDHGIVAPNCLLGLGNIGDVHVDNCEKQ